MRGYVSAYDVKTGSLRWRFYTVPTPADAELIRAYVARQAAMLYEEDQARSRKQ